MALISFDLKPVIGVVHLLPGNGSKWTTPITGFKSKLIRAILSPHAIGSRPLSSSRILFKACSLYGIILDEETLSP